jgi:anti-anti-sigma factor
MAEAKILVGRTGDVATFKIVGVGTYQGAVSFRNMYFKLLAEGVRDFVIDLGECEHLDSTYLGIILGLGLKARDLHPPGHVRIIHPNDMLRSLFRGTGLDQIFDMAEPTEE